ncbi:MAG TPA: ester cyclase [Anaerolineae bacterium]|nr:ester cyclase [Anaerolineae bacterium]
MSTEENKKLYYDAMDAFNRGDLDTYWGYFSPDFVNHSASLGGTLDLEGAKQSMQAELSALPDLKLNVVDVVAEGDMVAARGTMTGTQTGSFQGIAPTGKQVSIESMVFLRIVDGKFVENWEVADTYGMMVQLGVIPEAKVA